MILQALYQRYVDLSQDPDSGISKRFFSMADVAFVLEIESDGSLSRILDIREEKGKKLVPIKMNVPEQGARSSGIKSFFLCDKLEYLLGYVTSDPKVTEKKREKQSTDAIAKFESSKQLHIEGLGNVAEEVAQSVIRFYEQWDPRQAREHPTVAPMLDILDKTTNQVAIFKVKGFRQYVHDSECIRQNWVRFRELLLLRADQVGQCLITGTPAKPIARIHETKIKGVRNAQQAGASIVSFNCKSFESYGKDQSFNAPTSDEAVFGYTTALNQLLTSDRNRLTNMGDMTVVFWSGSRDQGDVQEEVQEETEDFFRSFFVDAPKEEGENKEQDLLLRDIWLRVRNGDELTPAMVKALNGPFYVLGLSPNNARVGIRFFWQGNLKKLFDQFSKHARDLEITRPPAAHDLFPTVTRILLETVRKDAKDVWKSISPSLGGHLFRSIMEGTLYPYPLFAAVLNRIKVEGEVNPTRAAIIKAYLARYARIHKYTSLEEVVTVELNSTAQDVPYRLGRLFAVLEKAQIDAAGGYNKLNSTIKDRYFASAAGTPGTVFPVLLKLAQHHMSKSEYGSFRDREIQDIMAGIDQLPSHLNLQQQGVFMLGYYHQKQSMFKKGEKKNDE
ncbi:type I-C CRISPR-associated protein Cas8c/Csd1 [Paenibacillus profundus]|uniref:Type I-C CRISPR-associated protein Cas8c/Csd1 n=1 Tax=Paenibacillus profundus TaxID=1173085 RepID=A0ABS8YNX8_9BACL|nr:type I-C CRISPR-associated protein Cas8c/Csd1 [Paenibacillus profundus]MCE5173521.1 type I-C CRISPR-associated protein Cas8c/Csd1 [Paenibacillus profundus]